MEKTDEMYQNVDRASRFIKALANETRLVVLYALAEGEKTASELEQLLGVSQPSMYQQLARLKADKMVSARREAKEVYYRFDNEDAELLLNLISKLFCTGERDKLHQRIAV